MQGGLTSLLGKVTHPYAILVAALTLIAAIVAKGFPVVKEWIGFKKEVLDYEKTKMEVAESRAKQESRVTLASFDDVKRFDPKYRALEENMHVNGMDWKARARTPFGIIPLALAILLILGAIIYLTAKYH
jgi:hypothetical protein